MFATIETGAAATIRTIDGLQAVLLDAFQNAPEVRIDASDVQEVDLSFVQMIEAARKYAADTGRALRLTAPANASLHALLLRAGVLTHASPADLEFWFDGETPQ